jgi:hypothetical protein
LKSLSYIYCFRHTTGRRAIYPNHPHNLKAGSLVVLKLSRDPLGEAAVNLARIQQEQGYKQTAPAIEQLSMRAINQPQ